MGVENEEFVRRLVERPPPGRDEDDGWENGPDAARSVGDPSRPVEVVVLIVVGAWAEVRTPLHPADAPLRVDAEWLAERLAVSVRDLPGRRFPAVVEPGGLRGVELSG